MSKDPKKLSRREAIRKTGAAAALGGVVGSWTAPAAAQSHPNNICEILEKRIGETPFIDTHEHLIEEEERLQVNHPRIKANDWSFLLSHYIDSDLIVSGMSSKDRDAFLASEVDPIRKWDLIEPYWPAVRDSGYGQAVEIAMRELYGVGELSRRNIPRIQEEYLKLIRPGFYKEVLGKIANIESCQVNCLSSPFSESQQPLLLMQDISFLGMHMGPNINAYAPKAGIEVKDLSDWYSVIDWWFEHYGPYAVAIKSQAAYSRNLDYEDVPAERAEAVFKKRLDNTPLSDEEKKRLEDHLFWYCVRKAVEWNLPVKLHTGYYAGCNRMPLSRLQGNPGAITGLCLKAPDAKFVFMHICYPYYEELIAAAKQYSNAYIDMCWAWIINPSASADFLQHYLGAAPSNKLLTFGGDYIPVEPVVGHAFLARLGIRNALSRMVDEGWLTLDRALALVEPIMNGNARRLFQLEKKTDALRKAPWIK
ncbi:MAG: amidohydrolase family protein [Candidatus Omnitrophota bacterium]